MDEPVLLDPKLLIYSLINYKLVAAGHRIGAIVKFIPDEAVLYSILDMGQRQNFLILNKDAPQELKDLMTSLPELWKSQDKGPYHLAIGRLLGYTEPANITLGPGEKKSIGIAVKGTFKGQPVRLQIAPQLVSEANFQQGMDTLNRLKPHIESVKIPGYDTQTVIVYDDISKYYSLGGRRRKTRRNRKPM